MNFMVSTSFSIFLVFTGLFICSNCDTEQYVDRKLVKCLVCQRVIDELYEETSSVDPSLGNKVGSYALDEYDNKEKGLNFQSRRSEVYLVELMDKICKRMSDYVRAFNKLSGLIEVIPLVLNGKMNPALSEYTIVTDGDVESLTFYCESIISDYEEELIELFTISEKNIHHKICYSTEVCKNFDTKNYLHNEL